MAITTDDVAECITTLERQLFSANTHFEIYRGIAERWPKCFKDCAAAPAFWNMTLQAHIDGAVVHLCRVYDTHSGALHLYRLLEIIEKHAHLFCEAEFRRRNRQRPGVDGLARYTRTINPNDFASDRAWCDKGGKAGAVVIRLRKWRNNAIAHLNEHQALELVPPLNKSNPLLFQNIQELIDRGLKS